MTALFSIPAGLGLSVLSGPVSQAVFGAKASIPITSRTLAVMGVAAIFASLVRLFSVCCKQSGE
ncbi:MAG: hypothetical protein ACLR13_00625 [Acutalibacteraceae bacterium]